MNIVLTNLFAALFAFVILSFMDCKTAPNNGVQTPNNEADRNGYQCPAYHCCASFLRSVIEGKIALISISAIW